MNDVARSVEGVLGEPCIHAGRLVVNAIASGSVDFA